MYWHFPAQVFYMDNNIPLCPIHKIPMVLKTAKRGRNAGSQFYGCPKFPACRETIDYNPRVHPDPDEQPDPNTTQNQYILDDFPAIDEEKRFQHMRSFRARARLEGYDSRFYESIAAPIEFVSTAHRRGLDSPTRRSISQWRLELRESREKLGNDLDIAVLSVVEKVLLRGSITPASPGVEKVIAGYLDGIRTDSDRWILVARQLAATKLGPEIYSWSDSDEEELFYSEVLPSSSGSEQIRGWVIPQVHHGSIIDDEKTGSESRRVDFLLCHPSGLRLIFEIDGKKHQNTVKQDRITDQELKKAGYRVHRIPAKEVRDGNGENLIRIEELVAEVDWDVGIDQNNKIQTALLLTRCAHQIQVCLLEAIKSGYLRIGEDNVWQLQIEKPEFISNAGDWERITNAAVNDFLRLLSSIYKLYKDKGLEIQYQINFNGPASSGNTNFIQLIFDDFDPAAITPGTFYISGIYTPYAIGHSFPSPVELTDLYADEETVKFLLGYIFQKEDYMDGQWDAIRRTLERKDSIVLLPTGGGKSIAFQLAALLMLGPCIVVEPLIALIQDQVDNLADNGITQAAGISSLLDTEERLIAQKSLSSGHFLFCYVSPERFQIDEFRNAVKSLLIHSPVSMIVIDEAHCVSEWGHDFRTSYLTVAQHARALCSYKETTPPLIALTGTASRVVLKDVQRELEILEFGSVVTPSSFDRPELNFSVVHCGTEEKKAKVQEVLADLPERFSHQPEVFYTPRGSDTMAGLVFFMHVNGDLGIVDGFQTLSQIAPTCGLYSGKPPKGIDKEKWQGIKSFCARRFKNDELTVLACTKAYGMGIDKPNIRYTIHYSLPRSLEAFYQEAGRAGRNRQRAECIVIVSDNHPQRTERYLNPRTSISQIKNLHRNTSWGNRDDIDHLMWFQTNSFVGVDEEFNYIKSIIREIGDLRRRRTEELRYTDKSQDIKEKAIYRLMVLGVISDYTIVYKDKIINVQLSGAPKEVLLEAYSQYLASYDSRMADNRKSLAREKLSLGYDGFLDYLLKDLVQFLYNTIELGRRRSLAEMRQAVALGHSGEDIRNYILNYLELGKYAELLESALEPRTNLTGLIEEILEDLTSPNDAAALRGQTARMLESYPDNPALLLIRSLAEGFSRDHESRIVIENLKAAIQFAQSPAGWALPADEITDAILMIAARISEIVPDLPLILAKALLDTIDNTHFAATRILLSDIPAFELTGLNYLLLSMIDNNEFILDQGDTDG